MEHNPIDETTLVQPNTRPKPKFTLEASTTDDPDDESDLDVANLSHISDKSSSVGSATSPMFSLIGIDYRCYRLMPPDLYHIFHFRR